MASPRIVMDDIAFGESPRWHDGRLWFSDWGAREVIALDPAGQSEVVASVTSCIASGPMGDGLIALISPDGSVRQVADGLAFPNGMAVTPDDSTLIVAESYGNRLTAYRLDAEGGLADRRTWAKLGTGVPDGLCLDAEGAVWYADVPNQVCVRVREGGKTLQTIGLDRGGFACALGEPTVAPCSSPPSKGVERPKCSAGSGLARSRPSPSTSPVSGDLEPPATSIESADPCLEVTRTSEQQQRGALGGRRPGPHARTLAGERPEVPADDGVPTH